MPPVVSQDIIFALSAPVTPLIVAGDLISSIRYQIPDPTFDPTSLLQDNPYNPDHEGNLIPKALLYRWLWDGMRDMSLYIDLSVSDWWAMPAVAGLPTYQLDARFYQVEAAFAYQFRCYPVPEPWTLYPSQAIAQPLQYGWHKRAGAAEVFYWPTPARTDASTTLTADLTPTDTVIAVTDTTGFLPFGWCRIEAELMQYQTLTPTTISVMRRGAAGTQAVVHYTNMDVLSCSLWVKGLRTPTQVMTSTDPLEIPQFCTEPLESFVLQKVFRGPSKDIGEAQAAGQQYLEQMTRIKNNPSTHGLLDVQQVGMYGSGYPGGLTLYGSDPFGYILP